MVCDIVDYYPSITANLFDQALDWASLIVDISADDRTLFHHTKNSLLCHEGSTWVKRGNINFDIAQGSFDGAWWGSSLAQAGGIEGDEHRIV